MNDPSSPPPPPEMLTQAHLGTPPRRYRLPLILFVLTCFSTFIAGVFNWSPLGSGADGIELRRILLVNWAQGLAYMGTVIAIIVCHEMGHFLAALWHRVPASYPYFIPFPISPIGTMGAVISMKGSVANRRQIFDIGIAGPIAGLVVALPALWFGIKSLNMDVAPSGLYELDCPWIVRLMLPYVRPDIQNLDQIAVTQANALFIAAWVGLLITGLNMMPISQLDGGHVIYTLLLKRGHLVARLFLLVSIVYVVLANGFWSAMVILVILMGADHPPTADDSQPLGWFRTLLGYTSLIIPVLCFPLRGLMTSVF